MASCPFRCWARLHLAIAIGTCCREPDSEKCEQPEPTHINLFKCISTAATERKR
ncbi:hypothetical protein ARMGADRAFT_1021554 [Armillaria gallica]|uniref:Secreted protein n=1 Tax=Armillaria gallica TaxID=47427 RepID=A0A2H3CRL0_ARMGA|nr:hypothetical protein ARMGADRAFT_1021554 [Armillaria gallica]